MRQVTSYNYYIIWMDIMKVYIQKSMKALVLFGIVISITFLGALSSQNQIESYRNISSEDDGLIDAVEPVNIRGEITL